MAPSVKPCALTQCAGPVGTIYRAVGISCWGRPALPFIVSVSVELSGKQMQMHVSQSTPDRVSEEIKRSGAMTCRAGVDMITNVGSRKKLHITTYEI